MTRAKAGVTEGPHRFGHASRSLVRRRRPGTWYALLPWVGDDEQEFPTWREAFDYAFENGTETI